MIKIISIIGARPQFLGASDKPKQSYIEEIMPHKLELNQQYLVNPTVFHDIKIIFKTIKKIVN